jgi:hypothetical protein
MLIWFKLLIICSSPEIIINHSPIEIHHLVHPSENFVVRLGRGKTKVFDIPLMFEPYLISARVES